MPSISVSCRDYAGRYQQENHESKKKHSAPEKFAHELAEIDSFLSDEVERKLSTIPGKSLSLMINL